MGENAAALHTAVNSVQALGRGFDVNFDTRLLYCKGVSGSRIIEVDDEHTRDIFLYDDVVVPNVSWDIRNFQESFGRQSSGVCSFQEVRSTNDDDDNFLYDDVEWIEHHKGFHIKFIIWLLFVWWIVCCNIVF